VVKRKQLFSGVKRVVVKVGTNILTSEDGHLDRGQIESLCVQISELVKSKWEVVLVSSGAVAAGTAALGLRRAPKAIPEEQAAAAVGQGRLMHIYNECLGELGVGQILLTQADLRDRRRYLNARNTILTLLRAGVIPIVNENDTVAVDELYFGSRFGDNDILSALVANLVEAQVLIMLTDVDGLLYEGDGKLIEMVEKVTPFLESHIRKKRSVFGKGGMVSKIKAAKIVTESGEMVVIANGRSPGVLKKILTGESVGTLFLPGEERIGGRKRWIAFTLESRGILRIDRGAGEALERGKSLLPGGIKAVEGKFRVGDAVAIMTGSGKEFARGLANYSSEEVKRIMGAKTKEIQSILGYKSYDEVIHRDNLVMME
jgi:glutamate 5-kinase